MLERRIARIMAQFQADSLKRPQYYLDTDEDGVRHAPDDVREIDVLYGRAGKVDAALYTQRRWYEDSNLEAVVTVVGSRRTRKKRRHAPEVPTYALMDTGSPRQQLQELDEWFDSAGNCASEGLTLKSSPHVIRGRFQELILEIGENDNTAGWHRVDPSDDEEVVFDAAIEYDPSEEDDFKAVIKTGIVKRENHETLAELIEEWSSSSSKELIAKLTIVAGEQPEFAQLEEDADADPAQHTLLVLRVAQAILDSEA